MYQIKTATSAGDAKPKNKKRGDVMDFIKKLCNTSQSNVRAAEEFNHMSVDKMKEVCDAFQSNLNDLSFEKIMCFLHVCLTVCVFHPIGDAVVRNRLQHMLTCAKAHRDANPERLNKYERDCIRRGFLPYKTNAEIIEDDTEPLLKRVKTLIQEVEQSECKCITISSADSAVEIQVKKLKRE